MPPSPTTLRALSAQHGLHLDHVAGIEPVFGWTLLGVEEEDSDGFLTKGYVAERGGKIAKLNVSRFSFRPTQERFAWLVRNGFPKGPPITGQPWRQGSWFSDDIDANIAAEREALAA